MFRPLDNDINWRWEEKVLEEVESQDRKETKLNSSYPCKLSNSILKHYLSHKEKPTSNKPEEGIPEEIFFLEILIKEKSTLP